jgi:hypothetical protein
VKAGLRQWQSKNHFILMESLFWGTLCCSKYYIDDDDYDAMPYAAGIRYYRYK